MTTLVAPRYDSPVLYSDTGRMSREWYTFLVTLAKSHGPSLTLNDDLAIQLAMTDATNEAASTTVITGPASAGNAVLLWLSMQMAFQTVTPAPLGQAAIGVGVSTLYTVPGATRTFVKDFDICNTTAAAILVSIFLVPAAGAAGTGNALMYTQTVPALSTVQWSGNQILLPGATIQVQGSAVGLTITASGGEAT